VVAGEPESGRTAVTASFNVGALFERPWYGDLIRAARTLASDRAEAAIAMAQMSVEAFVEVALSALLRGQGMSEADVESEMNRLPGFNFRREETRDLWTQLTGDSIQQAVAWAAYVNSVKLRNSVVHRGKRATPNDAATSVERCTDLIQHMQAVLRRVIMPPHGGRRGN
jgi:hypothetical protein